MQLTSDWRRVYISAALVDEIETIAVREHRTLRMQLERMLRNELDRMALTTPKARKRAKA